MNKSKNKTENKSKDLRKDEKNQLDITHKNIQNKLREAQLTISSYKENSKKKDRMNTDLIRNHDEEIREKDRIIMELRNRDEELCAEIATRNKYIEVLQEELTLKTNHVEKLKNPGISKTKWFFIITIGGFIVYNIFSSGKQPNDYSGIDFGRYKILVA